LHPPLARCNATDTVDQINSGDIAKDDAVQGAGKIVGDFSSIFSDQDGPAASRVNLSNNGAHIELQAGGKEKYGAPMRVEGAQNMGEVFTLGHDAHVVFQHEDAGSSCPEDRLVVGKDDSIHRGKPPGAHIAANTLIGGIGTRRECCLQFVQHSPESGAGFLNLLRAKENRMEALFACSPGYGPASE